MEFFIRPFEERDIIGFNEIRRMRGVRETTTALACEGVAFTEAIMKALPVGTPNLSAVARDENGKETLVGNALLRITEKPKMRHTASLAISVRTEYQNMGIGRALLTELLDIADNSLMLVRVGLEVAEENARAIHLYESLGFVREGLLKYAYSEGGEFKNLVAMARYNLPSLRRA